MKTLLVIIFLIFGVESFCQELITYNDSINYFSIGLPKEWLYQVSKTSGPGIKLLVTRPKEKESESFVENFNVNIVPFPNSNIDSAYSDLKFNISKRKGYLCVSEKDTSINGIRYKWHVEKHLNVQTSQPMAALIVLGYKDGKGYMVTLAAVEESYHKYESLFRKIAGSFRL
jgi:hypothetical protein